MPPGDPCFVIAEAGVNHNGSLDTARELIDVALAAGADAVKFQTFRADQLVSKSARKADYQKRATSSSESQYEMLKRLELDHAQHRQLRDYCERQGIRFMSTAFDLESLEFLVDELDVDILKIPSGEITNGPLVLAHARRAGSGRRLIVSTGMCDMSEVETALGVIAFGLARPDLEPESRQQFVDAYRNEAARAALRDRVTLLHCTTEYPAPPRDINLAAMDSLRDQLGLPVGYSDHSEGIDVAIAAVARGACVVEKHFTLDRSMPGPDHRASLEPPELAAMIRSIRIVEAAIGDGVKQARESETKNIEVARKSLVAGADIPAGTRFAPANLAIKRPGCGRSPMDYWDLLGREASVDYRAGDSIDE